MIGWMAAAAVLGLGTVAHVFTLHRAVHIAAEQSDRRYARLERQHEEIVARVTSIEGELRLHRGTMAPGPYREHGSAEPPSPFLLTLRASRPVNGDHHG